MFVRGDNSAPWRGLRAKASAARSLDLRGAYLRSVLDIAAAGGGVRHKGGDVSMRFDVEASGEGNNLHSFKGFNEGFTTCLHMLSSCSTFTQVIEAILADDLTNFTTACSVSIIYPTLQYSRQLHRKPIDLLGQQGYATLRALHA